MKTLYIDVYFLINFTVDIISLYFAAIFSKVPTTSKRIILSGLVGAFVAIIAVLGPDNIILKLILSALGLFVMSFIAPRGVSFVRKLKFAFSFIIFEALMGGAVSFVWGMFDKYLSPYFDSSMGGAVNRKMLFLSLLVLLSIGVFRMLVTFFSNNESEGCVDVYIKFLDKSINLSALVDSGNLAIDPMDMSPILLIKREAVEELFPKNILDLYDIDSLDKYVKKRIRLIPVSRGGTTHVLVGIKVDSVRLRTDKGEEEIRVTVAVDKEGGTFGGYPALMPSAAINNAVTKN